jgi:tetratricopeptide (TPR) repeat protein
MNLGLVEADSGNNELAVSLITKAYLQGFSDPLVFTNLGEIQERLGRLPEAVASYERALGYDPRLSGINFMIGRVRLALGDVPRARAHLQRELVLTPGHREAAQLLRSIDGPPR